MRRLLLLSFGLAALLLVILTLQRAIGERLINRPFLGVWTQSYVQFFGGTLTRIEFARGGNLWITTFGQNRWRAHWEEGSAHQLIISGLDPTRPKAKEAFSWSISREGLSVTPMSEPGCLPPFSHPDSGYTLGYHYTRLGEAAWPTTEGVVGAWVTGFGPTRLRMPDGQIYPLPNARVLLDIRRGGELWIYRDGLPRHRGRWTGSSESPDSTTPVSFVEEDPNHPGNGVVWYGSMIGPPRPQPELRVELWGRQQDHGRSPLPRRFEDNLEPLTRVPDGPANRKPFIGAWRTFDGMPGPQLQLELLPGGELRTTKPGQPGRHGTWKEVGPWPRLIIRGMDPAHPDTETEWLWSQRSAFCGRSGGAGDETQPCQILTLVNARTGLSEFEDGSKLELERVSPITADVAPHVGKARP